MLAMRLFSPHPESFDWRSAAIKVRRPDTAPTLAFPDDGRTLLVEINDGYSLGSGGLVANLYAELLRARWEEITGG